MPSLNQTEPDVLVVGGGNAALCAAMTAREAGADVLLLESAPVEYRGGNSRHTRNLRYLHNRGNDFLTGPYGEDEFFDDLWRVTGGQTDKRLARLTIRESTTSADGCRPTAAAFNRPCEAHFIWPGPTRSFWGAVRR